MKRIVKLLSVVLSVTLLLTVAIVPASAVTNGKWEQGYSIVTKNGKATCDDSYLISSSPAFVGRKVYIKSACAVLQTKQIKNFYNNLTFTIKIYNKKNVLVTTYTKRIGEYFTMPRTFSSQQYKVVIKKNIPQKYFSKNHIGYHCNFIMYKISTKR